MWSIEPTSDSPSGVLVTGMEIVYGKVPRGYLQKVPSSGAALPLNTGMVCIFELRQPGRLGSMGSST